MTGASFDYLTESDLVDIALGIVGEIEIEIVVCSHLQRRVR